MKIALDLQGIQSEASRTRGIGRYSYEVVRNILSINSGYDFILVANGALEDLRYLFKDQLEKENISYYEWFAPCPLDYISKNQSIYEIGLLLRSYAIGLLDVDIFIITSFLEGFSNNCLTEVNLEICQTKVISIFYDLIPLLNPQLYLDSNPIFSSFYRKKIHGLKKFDALLAISESSANEVINYLGIDSNKVFNISSACDKNIFNSIPDNNNLSFENNYKFNPYILYTGAHDPRKNLYNLLKAYSYLPSDIKRKYKLILAGKIINREEELLDKWILEFSIDITQVIKLGYISDQELVDLYRNCSLFVFPSLHEGFGLPVLEAMSCGAPVIGSNLTSIPEVIGCKEAMFDPTNAYEMSDLIEKSLVDYGFRDKLLKNGHIQSEKFSWNQTARNVLEACESIIADEQIKSSNISWQFNLDRIKYMTNDLIDKIFIYLDSINSYSFDLINSIASCIDLINTQSQLLIRSDLNSRSITSWRVEGPFDSSYSLAILNRYLTKELDRYLDDLTIHITEGPGDYEPNLDYLLNYPDIFEIYKRKRLQDCNPDVISRNLYPPRVNDLESKFNIIHSYGWEESGLPKKWISDFNDYLQGISVMSSQVKKILIDNGVKIPISVVGIGLDHIDQIESDISFKVKARKYKFLHLSSCFPRKGIDILLQAYMKAFTINDDVSLIIKTFDNPHNDLSEILDKLKKDNNLFPDVVVIKDDLTDSQIKTLLLQSDALVAPSRGEGFGLPIGEAMRLGIPVITTSWGGQVDFCDSENSWLIDFEFVHAKSHFNIDQSYWAEPSVAHLVKLLIEVYSSTSEQLKRKTLLAKSSANTFTWRSAAHKNINFVKHKLVKYKNIYSKLGVLSTWNTKCGIASYVQSLLSGLNQDVSIFCPFGTQVENIGFEKILPCWDLNNSTQIFDDLLISIKEEKITTLLIQFNYGFYSFAKLDILIKKLYENDINILVQLHSTRDPSNDETKKLYLLKDSLKLCNRLLVHTIGDLNRLKLIGLINNVMLFPHGINNYEPRRKYINYLKNLFPMKRNYKIATYGFCLPNKGYKELLYAIKILKKMRLNIKLTIFSALYHSDYDWFYNDLLELKSELGLDKIVTIKTDYLSNEETIESLSLYDCIVYPYQNSNESSSASVRQGLASKRPVLVTPLDIFDDVDQLVNYLPGFKSEEIAQGIYKWFTKDKRIVENDLESKRQKQAILDNRRFSKLSDQLVNLINSLEINKQSL